MLFLLFSDWFFWEAEVQVVSPQFSPPHRTALVILAKAGVTKTPSLCKFHVQLGERVSATDTQKEAEAQA